MNCHIVLPNEYRDSVSLMQIATGLRDLEGIRDAGVVMMTEANLGLLDDVGLGLEGVEPKPSDLLIVVAADSEEAAEAAFDEVRAALAETTDVHRGEEVAEEPTRSIAMAKQRHPELNLTVISTPGEFASLEAEKALRLGSHVMLFSDGIDLDEERRIKDLAEQRSLLVMGPDCGTAIIAGVPLAFANQARPGPVGIVGATGTGIQAVVCHLDHLGVGTSHAIGTGGHDLHEKIGGISMLRGIRMLADDTATDVIVLLSKPPSPEVADRVTRAARETGKPVVVCFLGADPDSLPDEVHVARTLEEAARTAAALAGADSTPEAATDLPVPSLQGDQHAIRGLYSGGTLCFEATMVLGPLLDGIPDGLALHSNTPIGPAKPIDDPWHSTGHTLVDLGDDIFTRGRPHPMIDHSIRNERLLQEARDPQTAVVLLDVVLGHGSHPDPAGAMAQAVVDARRLADGDGRDLAIIATVVGTSDDPQGLTRQIAQLKELGIHTYRSHLAALHAAHECVHEPHGAAR